MTPRIITLAALFLLVFTSVFNAQEPTPTPPSEDRDTLKISTTLVQADVTVTDKNGNVVTDLRAEDFEIFENGKKQTLTNFSFISVDAKTPSTTPSPTTTKGKISIPLPAVKLKPGEVRRTYALVVDDLGLNFGNIFWAKQSLRKFINEQMQDGDLVAIVRTGAGVGATQSFTSDKRQLLAAIDKITWNAYGRSGIGSFDPVTTSLKEDLAGVKRSDGSTRAPEGNERDKEFEKEVSEFRNTNFAVGTLGALSYIIRGMRDLPGRKAVMLFSQGFQLGGADGNRILDLMRQLADQANRSSVVIYSLDPRGVANPLMANADDVIRNVLPDRPGSGRFDTDPRDARATALRESQMSLNYLAEQTGGISFINQNNLDKGLRQAVSDQSSYYLLGYQPDESSFDPKKSKFNQLEIRVKRSGLKVRHRGGFFGISDEKFRNQTAATPTQRLVDALTSPFGKNDINLNLYPVFQNDAVTGNVIQALVFIDAKDLKFTKTPEGQQKVGFDIVAMTFGDNGAAVDRVAKVFSLEVSDEVYERMIASGFVYALPVQIKTNGAYQFRVAIRDTTSDKIGSASQFIEVPDVSKRFVLSNILLDNFSVEEWQKVRAGGNRDAGERSTLLDATIRQYKRGSILRYDYVIYNPSQSKSIESSMRLIKDGKIVYEEKPAAVKTDGVADLTRLQTAGALSLGKNLESGHYILQLITSDRTNQKKVATQFVEFDIVE